MTTTELSTQNENNTSGVDGAKPTVTVSDIDLVGGYGSYILYNVRSYDDQNGLMWVSAKADYAGNRTIWIEWHPEPAEDKPRALVPYRIEQLDLGAQVELMFRSHLDEIIPNLFLQLADAADGVNVDGALAAAIKHANVLRRCADIGNLVLLIEALEEMDPLSIGFEESDVEQLIAVETAMRAEEDRLARILEDAEDLQSHSSTDSTSPGGVAVSGSCDNQPHPLVGLTLPNVWTRPSMRTLWSTS